MESEGRDRLESCEFGILDIWLWRNLEFALQLSPTYLP